MSILENRTPGRLSWDAVLFVALWAAQFWSAELSGFFVPSRDQDLALVTNLTRVLNYDPLASFMVIVLIAYLAADLTLVGRKQFWVKLAAVWVTIIAFVIVPTIAAIVYRHNGVPYLYIHDGAIQIEEAIKFLLAGKNPYVENYTGTPMAQWPFYEPGLTSNPALYHLIYLPLTILSSLPFYVLSQVVFGWYDQRFVYLLMFVILIPMTLRAARTPGEKLSALMVVALNPLFTPFFIDGRNDIIVSFWLVGAILLLQRGRFGWAGVCVAGAIASKQTAWFFVPFFVLYVFGAERAPRSWKQVWTRLQPLLPASLLAAAILLPFLFWNAGAFVGDTISYQVGASAETSYPIKSLGLGGLALGLGWIQHSTDAFPFSVLQIVAGSLTMLFLLMGQWRDNTIARMTMNYLILFIVFGFFSRVFNDNHLGFALTWLILPSFLAEADLPSRLSEQQV
jgi:hypothetical protein